MCWVGSVQPGSQGSGAGAGEGEGEGAGRRTQRHAAPPPGSWLPAGTVQRHAHPCLSESSSQHWDMGMTIVPKSHEKTEPQRSSSPPA